MCYTWIVKHRKFINKQKGSYSLFDKYLISCGRELNGAMFSSWINPTSMHNLTIGGLIRTEYATLNNPAFVPETV